MILATCSGRAAAAAREPSDVAEHLTGLGGEVTGTDEVALLVLRLLAGDEHQPRSGRDHDLRVRLGSGQVFGIDAFESHCSRDYCLPVMATVSYTRMADMTAADLELVNADQGEEARELPDRLMKGVAELERFQGPLKVSRLEHSLQSATRAYRAGKDKEYVAAALLHDIGDALAPYSHGEMVAGVLRPFVTSASAGSSRAALFQSYYYAHLDGRDRNRPRQVHRPPVLRRLRRVLRAVRPELASIRYDSLPLDFFRPIVEEVFRRPRHAADDMPTS